MLFFSPLFGWEEQQLLCVKQMVIHLSLITGYCKQVTLQEQHFSCFACIIHPKKGAFFHQTEPGNASTRTYSSPNLYS